MEIKNSFVLYTEDIDNIIEELDEFQIGKLIIAINTYVKTKQMPDFKFEPMLSMAFKFIKNKLDRDIDKWEQIKQARSEAGKKGGARKGNQNARKEKSVDNYEEKQTKQAKQTKQPVNVNDYVNVNVNDNVDVNVNEKVIKEKEVIQEKDEPKAHPPKFQKPTKEELTTFAKENNLRTDIVDKFLDYYEANGWKVGRNPMRNWKASYRNWCRNNYDAPKNKGSGNPFKDRLRKLEEQEKIIEVEEI